MGASDNYLTKKFVVNPYNNSESVSNVYDKKDELTLKKNYGELSSSEEEQLKGIEEATSSMKDINKAIKEIKKDKTLSSKEKGKQIKELQKQRTDIARDALNKKLIDSDNSNTIDLLKFAPSTDALKQNKKVLNLTDDMKKEYEQIASDYYKKYEKQGIYSGDKLDKLKKESKNYAKKTLMEKYKSQLIDNK